MDPRLLPCREGANRHPDWEKLYAEKDFAQLPWHTSQLDPDLVRELARKRIEGGTFLDVGAGVGTHSAKLAELGFDVTATDISKSAVQTGRKLYKNVRFLVDDVTATRINEKFDLVFDRGCLHSLPLASHEPYVESIHSLVKPGGYLFLKCMSAQEPKRDFGPLRFSLGAILFLFEKHFRVLKIMHTEFQGSTFYRPKAFFVTMTTE